MEKLPSELPIQQVCLEIKDAKKKYSFDLFEPPSVAFKNSIAFQQGVATGLSTYCAIQRKSTVDPFWVFGQLPKSAFSCETAGMLYGLGLVGHLSAFKSMDIYEILAQRHEETSAALLLGLAISKKGSAESALSQLIGVHIKDFLPTSSPDALQEIPLQVQIAALTSIGFLHLQSYDRRVSMVLLKELGRRGPLGPKSRVSYPPAYTASAGLALGLVNLGAGRHLDASGISMDQVEQLLVCVNSWADSDYMVPSCCLALLGMFVGSGDSYVADQIAIPDPADLRNPAVAPKPLHLFMRLLTKQLLSQANPFDISDLTATSDPYQNCYVAYIVAASCLAQGILHAGSQDTSRIPYLNAAYEFLESNFALPDNDTKSYMDHYNKSYLQFASDMITLAKCLVMSGSGDLSIFQALRANFLNGFEFSSTTAFWNHLALGLLTLGQGKFKVSAVGEAGGVDGLAVLAIVSTMFAGLNQPLLEDAFYFPHHWQFLWVLAVKPNFVEEAKLTLNHPEELFLEHTIDGDECDGSGEMERRYLETITNYSVSGLAPQQRELLKAFYCTFLPVFKPERCDMTVVHLLLSLDDTTHVN